MNYPIAIEPATVTTAYGVVVPDLPGCFSAGDTLDEAMSNAKEAMELWLETVIDDGGAVPTASPLFALQADPEYAGWAWAVVGVDLASLSDKAERINITLPSRVLRRIDAAAKHCGESRSGYIARRAMAVA
jgi:predicted RNase H-like HicB family nuclease